jgi:hypothetical protein
MRKSPMQPTRTVMALAFASAAAVSAPVTAQTPPALADLLRLAAAYHATYATRVSGTSLEEKYQLIDVSGGAMRNTVAVSSDVVLVNLNNQITALRDPYAVDDRAVRKREPRITALLAAPATPTMRDWIVASDFPSESTVYFQLDVILKVSEPTTALQFISTEHQPKLAFKLDGQKKMNGVQVAALRFDETQVAERTYLLKTRGNARASGRIWVDVASGAVHQTELWAQSPGESANVTVKYGLHSALNLLLPTETSETYQERAGASGPRVMGKGATGFEPSTAASVMEIQTRAYYSKATHTPIDLTKIK